MSELARHSTDYSVVERERPQVMADNLRVAAQLWASATVFFFGGTTLPRFRWVASRRGYASCMRHYGAGPCSGPDRM